jgi:hypothetical protein
MNALDNKGVKARIYLAMAWPDGPDKPGRRVSVRANSLDHAQELLEAEYGKGSIFYLRNEEDAARPR